MKAVVEILNCDLRFTISGLQVQTLIEGQRISGAFADWNNEF